MDLKKFLINLYFWPRRLRDEVALRRHQQRLYQVMGEQPVEYHDYLDEQIGRTIIKRDQPLQTRARTFIDHLADLVPLQNLHVLCVGCRNRAELAYFRQKGAARVTGIDLFSESPDISVMDMHAMTFPDASFDLVYASHSLEHAYDPARVAAEIGRVLRPGGVAAIEVPVHFEPRGSDRIDYGGLPGLITYFAPLSPKVIWTQEGRTEMASEAGRGDFLRVILTLRS